RESGVRDQSGESAVGTGSGERQFRGRRFLSPILGKREYDYVRVPHQWCLRAWRPERSSGNESGVLGSPLVDAQQLERRAGPGRLQGLRGESLIRTSELRHRLDHSGWGQFNAASYHPELYGRARDIFCKQIGFDDLG